MRHFIAAFAVLWVCAAPVTVSAQVSTPTPAEIADSVERVGGISNAIQLLFMVLLLVVAWRVAKPLIDSNTSANARATELQEALMKRIEREDAIEQALEQVRQQTAGSLERTAVILSDLETKTQAADGRNSAVKQINEHTDLAHEGTRNALKPIQDKLDQVIRLLNEDEQGRARRDETLNLTIASATRELMELKTTVQKLKDTGELDPAKVPDTDPALAARQADVAPTPPDVWDTDDNPDNV